MMQALDIVATGLNASQDMLDTISQNLANANTTAYKSETPEFQTLLYQDGIQPGANSTNQTEYPSGLEMGTGVKIASIKETETQGALTSTGNPYDMAINGSGYFQVQLPSGETSYTRDGSFQLNSTGQLVNSEGYQIIPAITVPNNATSVTVGEDGTVSVTLPGSQTSTQIGQIQLANFVNPQGLQPLGDNLYGATTSSGAAIAGAPEANGLGSIKQSYLESSNVSVVNEMVDMISAERSYQLQSQAASAVDNQLNYLAQAASGA